MTLRIVVLGIVVLGIMSHWVLWHCVWWYWVLCHIGYYVTLGIMALGIVLTPLRSPASPLINFDKCSTLVFAFWGSIPVPPSALVIRSFRYEV